MFNNNSNIYISKKFTQYTKNLNVNLKKMFPKFSNTEFVLTQITKLNEETGELSSEILARVGYQRAEKLAKHSQQTLEDEFADVLITSLLLAQACEIDINQALENKITKLEKRYTKE